MKRLLSINEEDHVVARALKEMDFVNARRRVQEVRERIIPGAPAHRHSGRLQSRRSGEYCHIVSFLRPWLFCDYSIS